MSAVSSVTTQPTPPQNSFSPDAFDARELAFEQDSLRILGDPSRDVLGIAGTVWSAVPTTGQAVFRGHAIGEVGGSEALIMHGDVLLTFAFEDDDITGVMRNIAARDDSGAYLASGEISFADGEIAATQPNDFRMGYSGEVLINDQTFELEGTADGLLRGTRFGVVRRSPIKALSATETDGSVLVDGTSQPFSLTILAETN